jgi:hypothetical protein
LSWLLNHAEGSVGTAAAESFKLNELHSVKEVKSFTTKPQIDHFWRPGIAISINLLDGKGSSDFYTSDARDRLWSKTSLAPGADRFGHLSEELL